MLKQILKRKNEIEKEIGRQLSVDSICVYDNGKEECKFFKEDSLHELRSVSKVLIALAYGIALDSKMKLSGGGYLTLNTRVEPVLKGLTKISTIENLKKIKQWTIRDLLTYSAGYEKQIFSAKYIKDLDEKDYLSYVLNYPIKNEVGQKYVYNNAEMFVLSIFFQEAFGINIADFVAKEIFAPLGIKDYIWKNFDKYCPGGTGLFLSGKDLFKIGKLILQKGAWDGKQIISRKYIESMCSCQIETPYAVKADRTLPKVAVGFVMNISLDGWVFKDGKNSQFLMVNFEKNQLVCILSSENDVTQTQKIVSDFVEK